MLGLLRRSAVDRRYRKATVRAVRTFQRRHHLRVTGRVNTHTWNLIAKVATRREAATATRPASPAPVIVAHARETLEALASAVGTADVLEFDLRLTADHQYVLMHDATLDRTTSCTGPVSDMTLADLQSACVDNGGARIPSLGEALDVAAKAGLPVAPELKDVSITDEDLAAFVSIVDQSGLAGRTYVQSFHPAYFPRLRVLDSRLVFVYLGGSSTTPATIAASGATIAGINLSGPGAAGVTGYHHAGLEVWAWTATTLTSLQSLWGMGVHAVFTDIPSDARKLFHPAA